MTERQDEAQTGVIFLSSSSRKGNESLKILSRGLSHIQGLEIGAQWEDLDGGELLFQLGRYTHLVMMLDAGTRTSRWLAFIGGFAMGQDIPLYFYTPGKVQQLPGYLSGFPCYQDPVRLLEDLQQSIEEYSLYRKVEEAREELIGRGYGLHDETMALAARQGDKEILDLFLRVGYSPDTRDSHDVPLLNHLVRHEHEELVSFLLENGADPNLVSGDRGNTALMDAASMGQTGLVSLLLAAGALPDHLSVNGQTALMMAVGENHVDIVRLLLKAGADRSPVDHLGMSAEKYARLFHKQEIITLFEEL